MKLYFHPASTTSRPVMLFAAENGIALDEQVVEMVLDEHILGNTNTYTCGDAITIADYFCVSFVALGELVGGDYANFPNVKRWLGRMKQLKNWKRVNEVIEGYAASLKGTPMHTV